MFQVSDWLQTLDVHGIRTHGTCLHICQGVTTRWDRSPQFTRYHQSTQYAEMQGAYSKNGTRKVRKTRIARLLKLISLVDRI